MQPWCTFAEPEKAWTLLNNLVSEDTTGQQLTLSFWIRALPSDNSPLYPKFTIFSSLGNPQQALLEVTYSNSSSSIRVQVRSVQRIRWPMLACILQLLRERFTTTAALTRRRSKMESTLSSFSIPTGCRATSGSVRLLKLLLICVLLRPQQALLLFVHCGYLQRKLSGADEYVGRRP